VARVGDREITDTEFREFVDGLPQGLKSSKKGLDGDLEHLQSLIDKELLLLEAHSRGLEQDAEFLRKVERNRNRDILKVFYEREIKEKIRISDAELRAYFAKADLDREVKLQFAAFATKEEADVAIARVRRGAEFATLTARPGADRELAALKNLEGRFVGKDALPAGLREEVGSRQAGALIGPVRFRNRYVLVQFVGERPAEFARYRAMLSFRLEKEKFRTRREELLEGLRANYAPSVDADGVHRLLGEAPMVATGVLDRDITLCTYKGGTVTSGYLVDEIKNHGRVQIDLSDSVQVVDFLQRTVLPDVLVLAEAGHRGLATEVVAAMQEQRNQMLVDELLLTEVTGLVQVTYEEAKAFHGSHPDMFSGPEYLEVQEILVETEEEAQDLVMQLQAGADADSVASERTLRPAGKMDQGRFHFHLFEAPLYGGLVEAAQEAPLHYMQGPVKLEGGYSIFWVLTRGRQPSSFEDKRVQLSVKNVVTRMRQNELFDAFVARLRRTHSDQVHIYESNLEKIGQTV
jgi:peptidyl-prolyl cis-trans isomerase C